MPHVITGACVDVMHMACVRICPSYCITAEPGKDRMAYIEQDVCIDCAACAPACPTGAIHSEREKTPADAAWVEVNRLYYVDREAARARVNALRPRVKQAGSA